MDIKSIVKNCITFGMAKKDVRQQRKGHFQRRGDI